MTEPAPPLREPIEHLRALVQALPGCDHCDHEEQVMHPWALQLFRMSRACDGCGVATLRGRAAPRRLPDD